MRGGYSKETQWSVAAPTGSDAAARKRREYRVTIVFLLFLAKSAITSTTT
jgi:hypothetical protein